MADIRYHPLQRPLPDGIVPEEVFARTETHWLIVMGGMLVVMMAVVVATGVTNALHPPSNVETVDPTTLHLGGEFAESNLGTAVERDGSVTVRLIAVSAHGDEVLMYETRHIAAFRARPDSVCVRDGLAGWGRRYSNL